MALGPEDTDDLVGPGPAQDIRRKEKLVFFIFLWAEIAAQRQENRNLSDLKVEIELSKIALSK